jgi:patatin-like phospholipase/acyl hydrolase
VQASPRAPEFRILAVSGGGFLGLYTAQVLARLEAQVGEPLARRFDLIAGTSVGAVLASSLAWWRCFVVTVPRCSRRASCRAGR